MKTRFYSVEELKMLGMSNQVGLETAVKGQLTIFKPTDQGAFKQMSLKLSKSPKKSKGNDKGNR